MKARISSAFYLFYLFFWIAFTISLRKFCTYRFGHTLEEILYLIYFGGNQPRTFKSTHVKIAHSQIQPDFYRYEVKDFTNQLYLSTHWRIDGELFFDGLHYNNMASIL